MTQFIKQAEDPNEPPIVKRMYLYSPLGTIEDFLYNMDRAISKKGENFTTDEIDSLLGNKLSAYRLLSFIATDGSEFDSKFEEWLNTLNPDITINSEDKEHSLKRWQQLKKLVSEIKKAEEGFNIAEGTKANQLLSLLDKTIDNLDSRVSYQKNIKDAAKEIHWPKSLPKNVPLRTVLQYEFRKLLYSGSIYGPALSSLTVDTSLSRDSSGKVQFRDFQQPKIDALLVDAANNNYEGIQYYSKLAGASENIIVKGFSFAKVSAEDDTRVSKRSYMINAKLETSGVIMDVEPVLDEIIKKGVPFGDSNNGVSKLNNFSDAEKTKQYKENTQAYLNGISNFKTETPVDAFNKKLNRNIVFSSEVKPAEQNAISKLINLNEGEVIPTDNFEYLYNKLKGKGFLPIKSKGKINIVKANDIRDSFALRSNLILILNNSNELGFLTGSGKVSMVETTFVSENIESLLANSDVSPEIKNAIQKFKNDLEPDTTVVLDPEVQLAFDDVTSGLDAVLNDDEIIRTVVTEHEGELKMTKEAIKRLLYIHSIDYDLDEFEDSINDDDLIAAFNLLNKSQLDQLIDSIYKWTNDSQNHTCPTKFKISTP